MNISNPLAISIGGLGSSEILVIVAVIFGLFVIIPLIFVAIAVKKAKNSEEKDYVPYHLMEPEERLLMLQGLRAKELISDEEFEKKRKNIMRELDGEESEKKEESTPPPVPEESPSEPEEKENTP